MGSPKNSDKSTTNQGDHKANSSKTLSKGEAKAQQQTADVPEEELTGADQDDAVMGEPTGVCPTHQVAYRDGICPVGGCVQTAEEK